MRSFILHLAFLLVLLPLVAQGEHPVDVKRAFSEQRYFDTLVSLDKIPQRIRTGDLIRMGIESAWALGLSEQALDYINNLKNAYPDYIKTNPDVFLIEAILQYQEGRWEKANEVLQYLIDQKGLDSTLRGEAYNLGSEIALRWKDYDMAISMGEKALTLLPPEKSVDARIIIAKSHYQKGRLQEAEEALLDVALADRRGVEVISLLVDIAQKLNNVEDLEKFLELARQQGESDNGSDVWLDYLAGKVAIVKKNNQELERLLKKVAQEYPESEPWRVILESLAEKYYYHDARSKYVKKEMVK